MTNDPVAAANEQQGLAARPGLSVALRAAAGSGKTKVLIDRFLRLCVEDSPSLVAPRSILAITFTRKAAVEIQGRLLERARRLALAPAKELAAELRDLFAQRPDPTPSPAELARAAGLYEQVLEDFSGLNVGTIHSFCQRILDRFALEAGLDPRFTVLENRQELVEEALDELEAEMAARPELRAAAAALAVDPAGVRRLVTGVFGEQMRLDRWLEAAGPRPTGDRSGRLPLLLRDLRRLLFPDEDPQAPPPTERRRGELAAALEHLAGPGLDAVLAGLGAGAADIPPKGPAGLRAAAAAAATGLRALPATADRPQLEQAERAAGLVLLTTEGRVRSFTAMRKDPELKERFQTAVLAAAAPALAALRELELAAVLDRNEALLRLGLRALDLYDDLKRRDRVVDFQDLEVMARSLLGDEAGALSLLYRLDDAIGHLLLDEFQDTNFNQWDLLAPFVEIFLAEAGDEAARTLFFVGDVKQSIYGFRGAEPVIFRDACALLQRYGQPVLTLPTNFRSREAVVRGVGELFLAPPLAGALEAEERDHVVQGWVRSGGPGRFLALAPFAAGDAQADGPDAEPDGRNADQVAADAAVRLVLDLKATGETDDAAGPPGARRPLRWHDFLVLCRQRTAVGVYEKAFQRAGIPIVPSGRGMLAASREVQDILALLRWLAWPEDDAALAAVLRSPLLRLSEGRFQDLLGRRDLPRGGEDGRRLPPQDLWTTLLKQAADPVLGPLAERLKNWRRHLGFENCHDLLRRIYREGDVLERYGLALGEQARFNLERLFDLALGAAMAGTPTVRRLAEIVDRAGRQGGQEEAALPGGGGGGRVRFMTIHGAKGLQAPVVLLVDADRPAGRGDARVRLEPELPGGALLLQSTAAERRGAEGCGDVLPPDVLQRAERLSAARAELEDGHLLYVALTRAADQLILLGGTPGRAQDPDTPLRRVRAAAAGVPGTAVELEDPAGLGRPPAPVTAAAAGAEPRTGPRVRPWTPPPLRERYATVLPSSVEGEALPFLETEGAPLEERRRDGTERGARIHRLLQAAADLGRMPPGEGPLWEEAAAVFADPELAWIFHPGTVGGSGRCEVPLIHAPAGGSPGAVPRRVTGFIDRLVLRPGRVDIVDYKTNRTGGDPARLDALAEHYRPQLEAYGAAVAACSGDRSVGGWLLFTDPRLGPGAGRLRRLF